MIVLSSDLDWAPAWATLGLVRQVVAAGVPISVMVTHPCESLDELRRTFGVELGLHPNFLPGSSHGDGVEEVLATVSALVPGARGVRAHGLCAGTALLEAYGRRGLIYDSSYLLAGAPNLKPVVAYNGVVQLPLFWEDDVQMRGGDGFGLDALKLEQPGLKVLNLHPIHWALNSRTGAAYARLKTNLAAAGRPMRAATPDDVAAVRHDETPGTADFLGALLAWLGQNPGQRGGTLADMAARALAEDQT